MDFIKNKFIEILNFDSFVEKEISNTINNYTDFVLNFFNIELDVKYLTNDFYNLAISNHVTAFDFCILFKILNIKYKYITNEWLKILEIFPILNLWLKKNELLFIKPNNIQGIEDIIKNVKSTDKIFIFPEGSLMDKSMFESRNNICRKKNIETYKNVLLPKKGGFNKLTEILKPDYITNITFKYILHDDIMIHNLDNGISIMNFFDLKRIKKITVVIDKIKVEDNTDINDIFREKDKLIDELN